MDENDFEMFSDFAKALEKEREEAAANSQEQPVTYPTDIESPNEEWSQYCDDTTSFSSFGNAFSDWWDSYLEKAEETKNNQNTDTKTNTSRRKK